MPKNARELIDLLVERGMTQTEIADELERDQSYVSQVRRGKKVGANLVTTLEEIAETGTATTRPERRKTARGVSYVRGKKGGEKVLPRGVEAETTPRSSRKVRKREPVPLRGKYQKQTTYGRGFRKVRIDFPRTKGSKGKEQAWQATGKSLQSLARRKWGGKDLPERKVHISATYEDGSKVEFGSKGGYRPEAILGGLDGADGDVEKWLQSQGLGNRYSDLDAESRMVAIEISGVVR